MTNTHAGLRNYLDWARAAHDLGEGDRVVQKAPFGFDASVIETFWPLSVGAAVVMASAWADREPRSLLETIEEHRATMVFFVPAALNVFLDEPGAAPRCASIRRVICGGDALPSDLARRFAAMLPSAELLNFYGPTEAAVNATAYRCEPRDEGRVSIGRPIGNCEVFVLDEDLQPVPPGVGVSCTSAAQVWRVATLVGRGRRRTDSCRIPSRAADAYTGRATEGGTRRTDDSSFWVASITR